MLTLLSEQLAPVTTNIGFLRAPLQVVVEAVDNWNRTLYGSSSIKKLSGDLPVMVKELEPLIYGVRERNLLVASTDGEWTACFDSLATGTDPISTIGYLSETMQCQGLAICSEPHTVGTNRERPGRHGAVKFELFGPLKTDFLNYVRVVSMVHDGTRWRFDADGRIQDFERVERYRSRKVRNRFDSHLLAEYCAALDVFPFEAGYYSTDGVLCESPVPSPSGLECLSLADVQRRLGIVPGTADDMLG